MPNSSQAPIAAMAAISISMALTVSPMPAAGASRTASPGACQETSGPPGR